MPITRLKNNMYLAIVDLSTFILLDGRITGSTMSVDIIGSKKFSGASESNNSSSLLCWIASFETFSAISVIPTLSQAPPIRTIKKNKKIKLIQFYTIDFKIIIR